MRPFPGLLALSFLLVCSTPPLPRAGASTRVAVSVGSGTFNDVCDRIEEQTGWTIARECDCGYLQTCMRSRISVKGLTLPVESLLRLYTPDHCGRWIIGDGRAYMVCGRPRLAHD